MFNVMIIEGFHKLLDIFQGSFYILNKKNAVVSHTAFIFLNDTTLIFVFLNRFNLVSLNNFSMK